MPKHARWFCQFAKQAVAKKRSLSKMKHGCTYIPLQEVRKVSKSVHTPIPATVTTGIITVFYWIPIHLHYIKTDYTHIYIYIICKYVYIYIYIYTYTCVCVSKLWYHCVYITMYVYCVCCIPCSQTRHRPAINISSIIFSLLKCFPNLPVRSVDARFVANSGVKNLCRT